MESALRERLAHEMLHHQLGHDLAGVAWRDSRPAATTSRVNIE